MQLATFTFFQAVLPRGRSLCRLVVALDLTCSYNKATLAEPDNFTRTLPPSHMNIQLEQGTPIHKQPPCTSLLAFSFCEAHVSKKVSEPIVKLLSTCSSTLQLAAKEGILHWTRCSTFLRRGPAAVATLSH